MILSLPLLLAGLTLLAPQPPVEGKADAAAHETLRQVAAMAPAQQQAWLRELKARLDWANRLTLSPEEAARQRTRVADLLQQKTVSFQTALELVRQRDARESEAVTHLVQRYRSQVYQTFQGQGPTFTERQEAWYRVWGLWEAAGSPTDQRNRLIAWLDAGIRNSTPGKIAPLPPDPTFTSQHPASKLADKKKTPSTTKPGEAANKPTEITKTPDKSAKKSEKSAKKSDKTAKKTDETSKTPSEALKKPEQVLEKTEDAAKKAVKPPKKTEDAAKKAVKPPKKTDEPAKKTDEPAKKTEEPPKKAEEPAKKTEEPSKKADEPAKKPEESSKLSKLPAEEFAATAAEVARHPVELPPGVCESALAPPEPDRAGASVAGWPPGGVRPSSVPEEAPRVDPYAASSRPSPLNRDPLAMLPKAAAIATVAVETPPLPASHRAASPSAASPKPASTAQVQVNTEELAAQIAGSNLALRTLEAELDEKHAWDARRLEAIFHRLDVVVTKNRDLGLFRDLVSPAEQALVGQMVSPRTVIAQLAARIAEVRSRVQGGDFAGAGLERQAELRRLDALSVRLGNLAAEK